MVVEVVGALAVGHGSPTHEARPVTPPVKRPASKGIDANPWGYSTPPSTPMSLTRGADFFDPTQSLAPHESSPTQLGEEAAARRSAIGRRFVRPISRQRGRLSGAARRDAEAGAAGRRRHAGGGDRVWPGALARLGGAGALAVAALRLLRPRLLTDHQERRRPV